MQKLRIALVVLSVLGLGAGSAQAQRFGAQLDWGNDSDLGLGARLEQDVGPSLASEGTLAHAFLIGSFDLFFPSGYDYFEFNANLAAPVNPASNLNPYVGAGLNMARASVNSEGNTDLGLNLLGGLRFAVAKLSSYAEARLELGGGDQFVVSFGVLLGGNR